MAGGRSGRVAAGLHHHRLTVEAATRLHNFDGPVLLAWSAEDKLFPISLGHRLAAIFPDATVRPIDDSYTFSPEDQPDQLADVISGFLATDAGGKADVVRRRWG